MPRIVFLAIGSRGDVAPMVALARELVTRGHDTVVLAHPEYTDIPRSEGIPCISLEAGLVEHAGDQRRAQALMGNPVSASIALQGWQWLIAKKVAPVLVTQIRSDDVVITGIVGVAAALALAEDRGCTPVHVTFSATLPTKGHMAMMSPRTKKPSTLVGLWTRHGVWTGSLTLGRPLAREIRRQLRLPWRSPWAVAQRALGMPVMVAASPVLLPRQHDWPRGAVVTGAWSLAQTDVGGDEALEDWLQAHPTSVYVGFGSMLSRDPVKDLRLVDDAARRVGVPVVYRIDDSAPSLESTSMVHVVRHANHGRLFPRCAAVVHHGGAGTTHAALAAGVPSAVVAHGFDQPFHGRRLRELGVGPGPVGRQRLSVDALAKLLRDLTQGPRHDGYAERAAAVGRTISQEDGAGTAADWLEYRGLIAKQS
ncbi:MAG: glycosyltransferase [Arachnia sp.]